MPSQAEGPSDRHRLHSWCQAGTHSLTHTLGDDLRALNYGQALGKAQGVSANRIDFPLMKVGGKRMLGSAHSQYDEGFEYEGGVIPQERS